MRYGMTTGGKMTSWKGLTTVQKYLKTYLHYREAFEWWKQTFDNGLFSETKMLSILSVLLSLMITIDAYTFVYQPMPLYPMYQGGECKINVNKMFNVILGV